MNNQAKALNIWSFLATQVNEITYQPEKSVITWSPSQRLQARCCDPSGRLSPRGRQQDPEVDTDHVKGICSRQDSQPVKSPLTHSVFRLTVTLYHMHFPTWLENSQGFARKHDPGKFANERKTYILIDKLNYKTAINFLTNKQTNLYELWRSMLVKWSDYSRFQLLCIGKLDNQFLDA